MNFARTDIEINIIQGQGAGKSFGKTPDLKKRWWIVGHQLSRCKLRPGEAIEKLRRVVSDYCWRPHNSR